MEIHHLFRFGVVANQAGSAEEWETKARRAEALGFSTFLMPDHLGPGLATIPALAVAAAVTRTIHLGTYVLANDFRNPVQVARESATLDVLSRGRFELGIGAGRPTAATDYRMLGIPMEAGGVRVERLGEAIEIVKTLLSGQKVSAPGRHYAIADAEVFLRPVQRPRLPILVAGAGKRLLSLAARQADIVALGLRPDESEADLKEKIEWVRQAAGDRFQRLEINVNLIAVGNQVPRYLRSRLGFEVAELERSRSPFVLMGTPVQMCDQLRARREALGVSYVTVSEDLMEALAPVVERLAGS